MNADNGTFPKLEPPDVEHVHAALQGLGIIAYVTAYTTWAGFENGQTGAGVWIMPLGGRDVSERILDHYIDEGYVVSETGSAVQVTLPPEQW